MKSKFLLFILLISASANANWSYFSNQQYHLISTIAKESDQFGETNTNDFELVISFDMKDSEYFLGFIGNARSNFMCPSYSKPKVGEQTIVDFGVADINGTYVQFEAVCIGTFFPETKGSGDWVFPATTHWVPEFQPKNKAGISFIVSELKKGNSLTISFDELQLPSSKFTHTVDVNNFSEAHAKIERRKSAL
ncbi:hypothetical protein ACPV56_19920 [Vibrio astriarenae]